MWFLLVTSLIIIFQCVCNNLDETVAKIDAELVRAIIDPKPSDGNSVRKNVLRLELALGEIGERIKDRDKYGLDTVDKIIKNGGLKLSTIDYINDTMLMNTFNWTKDMCEELKYNLQQICSTWFTMEGGIAPTMVYISGRNRSVGLQYMEKYM